MIKFEFNGKYDIKYCEENIRECDYNNDILVFTNIKDLKKVKLKIENKYLIEFMSDNSTIITGRQFNINNITEDIIDEYIVILKKKDFKIIKNERFILVYMFFIKVNIIIDNELKYNELNINLNAFININKNNYYIIILSKNKIMFNKCISNLDNNNNIILCCNRKYINRFDNICYVYNYSFNYAKIHNDVLNKINTKYVVLLNDDVIIKQKQLDYLLYIIDNYNYQIVGCRLLYPNNTIQHGGIYLDKKLGALHIDRKLYINKDNYSSQFIVDIPVTFACVVIRKDIFDEIKFDERFAYNFNDIDFCIRVMQKGYKICYVPLNDVYHLESYTRKNDSNNNDINELKLFKQIHGDYINENSGIRCKWIYR